jgi:GTPase
MAFIDEVTIHVKAGNGGDGVVRWHHEKNKEFGGPSGGDGGNGGDVYALATRNIYLLSRYRAQKEFRADSGEDGKGKSLHGADGDDLDILFPVGSIITNKKTGKRVSLLREDERILLLNGGTGGRGNESYKSSTNQTPREWTPGTPGDGAEFFIEIELIADIGLIGLPNAGKTSLLNALTRAKGKVGAYPFTTLEPVLGECFGYIISDIPGLIEGAADGKGLGHKFLRHIKRTKVLVHLVSLENENPREAYDTIRKELGNFDKELLQKKEIVLLTKSDMLDDVVRLENQITEMKKVAKTVFSLTLYDDDALKAFRENLLKEVAKQ